jgi:uncharacterized protein
MKKLIKFLLKTVLVIFIVLNVVTAFHAYKFSHFYEANEAPAQTNNQKNGWDITKEILFGINAFKQQNAIPKSSFEQIYITTSNQIKLNGWYFKGEGIIKGTVLLFHGHGSKKSAVLAESEGFRQLGYNTLLIDFRAHGTSGGNTSTIGYKETEDVKLAYDFIKARGEKNIILWGISMGAACISKAMVDYPLQPSKVIVEMPFASILQAAEGRIKMMKLPAQPLATLVTFWGGVEQGFWAFNMQPVEFAKQINVPTLIQWGKNDPRVKQTEIEEIYNNLPASKKLVIYEHAGHESLCEKEPNKWLTSVQDFLQ